MNSNGFILEAQNIYKSFVDSGEHLQVLKGIDLKVLPKEAVSILGPSGAGKSTLLHILGGLDRPSKGKVFLGGEDLSRVGDEGMAKIRNQRMGFVFQFYHLLPEFSALENVTMPLLIAKQRLSRDNLKNKGMELLKAVGLNHRAKHRPSQLSGGEQQRLAIARAIINSPQILFCDEPTGNLDSKTSEEIIDLLLELHERQGMTLLTVTHDEHLAKKTRRVVFIRDGKIES